MLKVWKPANQAAPPPWHQECRYIALFLLCESVYLPQKLQQNLNGSQQWWSLIINQIYHTKWLIFWCIFLAKSEKVKQIKIKRHDRDLVYKINVLLLLLHFPQYLPSHSSLHNRKNIRLMKDEDFYNHKQNKTHLLQIIINFHYQLICRTSSLFIASLLLIIKINTLSKLQPIDYLLID